MNTAQAPNIPWEAYFLLYPPRYGRTTVLHIGAPDWLTDHTRSCFDVYGETLCAVVFVGVNKKPHRYQTADSAQIFDAVPPGYGLCKKCVDKLRDEILPFC